MSMDTGLSAADIKALMGNGEGNGINSLLFLVFFVLLLGGGGLNFGGVGGQITNDFLFNNLSNQVQAASQQQNSLLLNGFQQQNQQIQNLTGQVYDVSYNNLSNFKDLVAQISSCCCQTNRNIDALRSEAFQNTCAITNAIHSEGEATRALITQNTIQDLRDKNNDLMFRLQSANNSIINTAQTQTIIGALRPVPQPAYLTCSPYATSGACQLTNCVTAT